MNKKLILSIFALALFSLFAISMASASVSFVYPASSSIISGGTVRLNVTNSSADEIHNCTFYAKSSLTGNSTWVDLGTAKNVTAYKVNLTIDSKILEDSNDYVFNATCRNSSNTKEQALSTSVRINNTAPKIPASLSPEDNTNIVTATTQTFSSTVLDGNTTSCLYSIGRGGISTESLDTTMNGTGTYSASTCSFTKAFTTSADNGIWYYYFVASDESDYVWSSSGYVNVQIPAVGGGSNRNTGNVQVVSGSPLSVAGSTTGSSNSNTEWIIGGILIVVGWIIIIAKRK